MAENVRSMSLRPSSSRVMICAWPPVASFSSRFRTFRSSTSPVRERCSRSPNGSRASAPIRLSSSLPIRARSPRRTGCGSWSDRTLEACRGPIDTLIVAGGRGVQAAARDPRLTDWLRLAARRSRRVTSVCTGAFLLARAGLLDGRRATTHWNACAALARHYPSVRSSRTRSSSVTATCTPRQG